MLITTPTIDTNGLTLRLERQHTELVKMDMSQVVVAPPGARWSMSFTLRPFTEREGREWYSALTQLSNLENTFEALPPDFGGTISGYIGPNPVVNGGGQLGTSLTCDGVTASTLIARAGDYMEVQGAFKVITADAISDGTGNVTLNFEPAIRQPIPDNAVVELQAPKVTMRLANPEAVLGVRLSQLYGMTVDAAEAF